MTQCERAESSPLQLYACHGISAFVKGSKDLPFFKNKEFLTIMVTKESLGDYEREELKN